MVSYADFITLLFAFFVMMYSISVVNTGKFKVLSESLTAAFQDPNRSLEPIQIGELVRSPADRPQDNFAQNDPTRQRPVEIRQLAELAGVEQEALRRAAEQLDVRGHAGERAKAPRCAGRRSDLELRAASADEVLNAVHLRRRRCAANGSPEDSSRRAEPAVGEDARRRRAHP